MRPPPPIRQIKKCSVCGESFRPRQGNQHACGNCRGRTLHNKPKWKVTRVEHGKTGGYAFSVSVDGGPPLGGYFMTTLTGYVRFPQKLVISLTKRKRLQKPLRKQVAHIVTTHDPRYHSIGEHWIKPSSNDQAELRSELEMLEENLDYSVFDDDESYNRCLARVRELRKQLKERGSG